MLRSFFIITLRILWRNKVTSFINIFSLTIGITAFILIMMYVHHETSYDKFNENYDRIYRLEGDEYAKLPPLIGEYISDKIPEIEKITQLQIGEIRNFNYIPPDNPENRISIPIHVLRADSAIFDIFTLPFVKGNPKYAFSDPFTVVLTESFARKLFGSQDPMGKTIVWGNLYRSNNEFKVTGILRDLPSAHVKIDALISREILKIKDPQRLVAANQQIDRGFWYGTYLLLEKNTDSELVMKKISNVLADINDGNTFPIEFKHFYLRPLTDLYLKGSATQMIYGEQGNNDLLWSFMAIGLFVLLLAIINYINLTTARSTLRSKEVILKKVMGSSKALLRQQFIAESILVAFISFLIALTTIQLVLPKFNQLAQVNISLSDFSSPIYWTLLLAGMLTTGMISGIYPAMMLTTFRSLASTQAKSVSGTHGVWFRRSLLTFQFSISIILIIGIITNLQQLHFVKNADPGFNKDQVILVRTPSHFEEEKISRETFKDRLYQYPNILSVAFGGRKLGQSLSTFQLEINGTMKFFQWRLIDPDYLDVMDIKLLEGRNFSWERLSDKSDFDQRVAYLINETAARKYWNESPVGKTCYITSPDGKKVPAEIIGVVKDVHMLSFHHKVEPMAFFWGGWRASLMSIKVSPQNLPETIDAIESEWKKLYGTEPFIYSFLDEEFEALYTSDERTAKIIGYFTILAIIIACMGLFALSSFMAVRRTKEIGIRKALGASSMSIFVMLSREYFKWILLSIIIASPIAWILMNSWLQEFAYRIELGSGIFILAAILALAIGLVTVGWQALKSAFANPVDALRYE